jgi:hypothetical protein
MIAQFTKLSGGLKVVLTLQLKSKDSKLLKGLKKLLQLRRQHWKNLFVTHSTLMLTTPKR